jgi:catalase
VPYGCYMKSKLSQLKRPASGSLILFSSAFLFAIAGWSAESGQDLAPQIFEVMSHAPGVQAGFRVAHAKGLVCSGTFTPSADAKSISRATHFSGPAVPVTVRFSDGAGDPTIPDNASDASPHGMAIRFTPPGTRGTDIVAISHNGFIVGTGEDFLALLKAHVATDPTKPHPWPIEAFVGSHPHTLKFVQDLSSIPASFATESYYGSNALTFINGDRAKQVGRYQIITVAGLQNLAPADAKIQAPSYLFGELKARLTQGTVQFRLVLQLAAPGDQTNDGSVVWPDDHKIVDLGVITISSVVPDNAAAEQNLAFDPTGLTDGIELSDDPLPTLRSPVYAMSVARRRSCPRE